MRRLAIWGLLVGVSALFLASCDQSTDTDFSGSTSSLPVPPPPEGTVHAVDMSFATDFIDAEDVACFKREYSASHAIVALNWGYFDRAINQLDHVVTGGMTVDAYVWINWVGDPTERVETALALIEPYPVRRLWLDIERDFWNRDADMDAGDRLPMVREAVAACGDFPCGIYTRKTFWNPADGMGGSTEFSDLPLWYAHYDNAVNFNDWYNYPESHGYLGPFGGWTDPTGKQYEDTIRAARAKVEACDKNIDWNVMYIADDIGGDGDDDDDGDTGSPPPPPTGLSPDGETIGTTLVQLSCDAISGALEYEFVIEYASGGEWRPYYTYTSSDNAQAFWPQYDDASYRWKVRARNAHGWGEFSDWADFDFGETGGGGDLPPAPSGLTPDGQTITASPVTLSCNTIEGVTEYEFVIEYRSGANWNYYFTYSSSDNAQAFWPQYDNASYRWKVRARNANGWGEFSDWAGFDFGETGGDGGDPPPAPTGLEPNVVTIGTPSVTLSCNAIDGVSEYEFWIEVWVGTSYSYYYTYSSSTNSKTFWPATPVTDYRWKVRARNDNGWGDWSSWAVFFFFPP